MDPGPATVPPFLAVACSGREQGTMGFTGAPDPSLVRHHRETFLRASGMDPEAAAGMGQVHGTDILVAGAGARGAGGMEPSRSLGRADGMVTAQRSLPLLALGADCCVVALWHREGRAAGVFHAGWRGAAAGVAGAAVASLCEVAGAPPGELAALFAPSIGRCCYQVGPEVEAAFRAAVPAEVVEGRFRPDGGDRLRLDLPGLVGDALRTAGLPPEAVSPPGPCTRCDGDRWFSHRAGDGGRNLVAVMLR